MVMKASLGADRQTAASKQREQVRGVLVGYVESGVRLSIRLAVAVIVAPACRHQAQLPSHAGEVGDRVGVEVAVVDLQPAEPDLRQVLDQLAASGRVGEMGQ